jgi:hypothetical protein
MNPPAMRLLFLDKARPATRRWVLLIAALALVEAVALGLYVTRPVPPSIELALASPRAQCETRGQAQLAAADEWPTTRDGRDALTLVRARCTLDAGAFR